MVNTEKLKSLTSTEKPIQKRMVPESCSDEEYDSTALQQTSLKLESSPVKKAKKDGRGEKEKENQKEQAVQTDVAEDAQVKKLQQDLEKVEGDNKKLKKDLDNMRIALYKGSIILKKQQRDLVIEKKTRKLLIDKADEAAKEAKKAKDEAFHLNEMIESLNLKCSNLEGEKKRPSLRYLK